MGSWLPEDYRHERWMLMAEEIRSEWAEAPCIKTSVTSRWVGVSRQQMYLPADVWGRAAKSGYQVVRRKGGSNFSGPGTRDIQTKQNVVTLFVRRCLSPQSSRRAPFATAGAVNRGHGCLARTERPVVIPGILLKSPRLSPLPISLQAFELLSSVLQPLFDGQQLIMSRQSFQFLCLRLLGIAWCTEFLLAVSFRRLRWFSLPPGGQEVFQIQLWCVTPLEALLKGLLEIAKPSDFLVLAFVRQRPGRVCGGGCLNQEDRELAITMGVENEERTSGRGVLCGFGIDRSWCQDMKGRLTGDSFVKHWQHDRGGFKWGVVAVQELGCLLLR